MSWYVYAHKYAYYRFLFAYILWYKTGKYCVGQKSVWILP